jgi:hypothetical protein
VAVAAVQAEILPLQVVLETQEEQVLSAVLYGVA